jgi:hypothetical protein
MSEFLAQPRKSGSRCGISAVTPSARSFVRRCPQSYPLFAARDVKSTIFCTNTCQPTYVSCGYFIDQFISRIVFVSHQEHRGLHHFERVIRPYRVALARLDTIHDGCVDCLDISEFVQFDRCVEDRPPLYRNRLLPHTHGRDQRPAHFSNWLN